MKVIIAGSRDITDIKIIERAMRQAKKLGTHPTEIISGTARGVDRLGEQWAKENGISIKRFPANWDAHGRGAGYIRNRQMAKYADELVAVWDRKSKGTKNMIDEMRKLKKSVMVYTEHCDPISP